jgi:hypothetical protein
MPNATLPARGTAAARLALTAGELALLALWASATPQPGGHGLIVDIYCQFGFSKHMRRTGGPLLASRAPCQYKVVRRDYRSLREDL